MTPPNGSTWQHQNGETRIVKYHKPGTFGPDIVWSDSEGNWYWTNWNDWSKWISNAKQLNGAVQ